MTTIDEYLENSELRDNFLTEMFDNYKDGTNELGEVIMTETAFNSAMQMILDNVNASKSPSWDEVQQAFGSDAGLKAPELNLEEFKQWGRNIFQAIKNINGL